MAGGGQLPKCQKPSIKYKHNPTGGACFELAEFNCEDYAPKSSVTNQRDGKRNESKSAEILSTADLISAIGHLWDCAILPPSVLETKSHSSHDSMNLKKRNMFYYPTKEGYVNASTSGEGSCISVNVTPTSHCAPMVQAKLEFLKVTQKISFFEPCSSNHINSLLWGLLKNGSSTLIDSLKDIGHANIGNMYNMRTIHQLLSDITLTRLKHLVNSNDYNKMKNQDCDNTDQRNSTCSDSSDANNPTPTKNTTVGNADRLTVIAKASDPLSHANVKPFVEKQTSVTSLRSECILQVVEDLEEIGSVISNSRPHEDCYTNLLAVDTSACRERLHDPTESHLQGSDIVQKQVSIEDKSTLKIFSSENDKPAFARQEHAFAGAFAGIFVSLCLHPVDTIKTVTQSCRSDQKGILDISRSIITDRGLTGLYRGIASNIASSAPISAIYAFTYESVKGGLLPLLPKEYHSFAHCVAGGSASIATSFIFTPSERIKQQMQVSSQYRSSWNALLGIVKKGGFSSLYAGWGAVLCRNVPHSIIKFYTYERLKHLMLSSLPPNGQKRTLQTLVCGGLAGSTAALFTTPFDVVKTRLQTQIPGSTDQLNGVFNTLVEIAKHEGLKGLYRGLTPRLVMYMTQGALFFASYESFKTFFSLDAPQDIAHRFQCEPKMKDDLTPFPKTA